MKQTKRAVRRQGRGKSIRITRALATATVQHEFMAIPGLNLAGPNPFSESSPLRHWFKENFESAEIKQAQRMSVAYHEAGHLFAAYYFGFALKDRAAELTLDGPSLGLTHFYGEDLPHDPSSQTRARLEESVVMLLAGGAAVRKLSKRFESGSHLNGDDNVQAKRIIEALTPICSDPDLPWHEDSSWNPYQGNHSERSCYLKLLEYRAERLVSQGWSAIERLATELLRSNALTANAVHRIVQDGPAFNHIGVLARTVGAQSGSQRVC